MVVISRDLPAGNIRVVSQDGNLSVISEEQRDSRNPWFYWKFKAVFDAPGEYVFRFENNWKVGTRSAAVSLDCGVTWHWLADTMYDKLQEFTYTCEKPGEVWFCQGIPYLQREFDAFAAEFRNHPAFHQSVLCKSRKGRDVELVTIQEGNPAHAIVLTSRHHCQEMAATHALEGILRAILADDDFGGDFRHKYATYVIPFVDKDGVEDGDQGKGRIPRDHGRDYYGKSIYPETAAIRHLFEEKKPFLVLDFHCPWLRSGRTNEETYIVENAVPRFQAEVERLGRILERKAPPCAPYCYRNTIRWGVGWNCRANAGTGESYGRGVAGGCADLDFVRFATSVEIPFANFGEHTITRYELLQFGEAFARAIGEYLDESLNPGRNATAKLCFTGDILCEQGLTAACTAKDGTLDYSGVFRRISPLLKDADYCIGNLETVFAGADAKYTEELYSFNTPDCFADAILQTGFHLVSTANNHCLDRGVQGLYRTLDVLDAAGVEHTGTFRTPDEQEKVCIRYINGIRVGFVASTYGTNAFANHTFLKPEEDFAVNLSMPQETLPGSVHLLNSMEQIAADVAKLPSEESREYAALRKAVERTRTAGAEYIVALMHSGGQYNVEPDAASEKLADALLAYGVDMIVGNHPHVIQRHAFQDGKPIFYCLGNVICSPDATPVAKENPCHVNSVVIKPVLQRTNGGIRMASCKFTIVRSVLQPTGESAVTPLYDLMVASTAPAEKKHLAEDLQRAVRCFLDLPGNVPVPLQREYDL